MADLPSEQLLFFTCLTRSANICLCHLCNLLCFLLLLAPFGHSALDSIDWILKIIQSAFPKAFHLCFYWKNLLSVSYNLILLCPYALLCTPVQGTIASCPHWWLETETAWNVPQAATLPLSLVPLVPRYPRAIFPLLLQNHRMHVSTEAVKHGDPRGQPELSVSWSLSLQDRASVEINL